MNPRIEEIKGRLVAMKEAEFLTQDLSWELMLATTGDDIAFLLAEVERLEKENCFLRVTCGNNLPPKPLQNATS